MVSADTEIRRPGFRRPGPGHRPLYGANRAAGRAGGVPFRMRGSASGAAPGGIGLGRRGAAQGIPLRRPALLGVAPLHFFDIGHQHPEPALIKPGREGSLSLVRASFARPADEGRLSQQKVTFRVARIFLRQPLRGFVPREQIRDRRSGRRPPDRDAD